MGAVYVAGIGIFIAPLVWIHRQNLTLKLGLLSTDRQAESGAR